jgi:thiamine-monophosphate kinase
VAVRELGERGLIERIRSRLSPPLQDVLVGVGDDAAAVAWAKGTLLLTTDMLLEDVHFRRTTTTFRDVGAKALAVNLSDIAAMGGQPRFAVLALAVPPATRVSDVDELYAGMEEMAARHAVALLGGDTCAGPHGMVLTVTVVGHIQGLPLCRSGARTGDAIVVTGTLGAAAAGLAVLERGAVPLSAEVVNTLEQAHRMPIPRVREGRLIHASGVATAMIDLSDGLASDLGHIARESGVGADVQLATLPVGDATRQLAAVLSVDPWTWPVSGGEDYELLFTVPSRDAAALAKRIVSETGTPACVIGKIRPPSDGVRFLDETGRQLPMRDGFDHFA